MKQLKQTCLAAAAALGLAAQPAMAQEFSSDPDWKIGVYLWALSLEGELGIGPITEDIDLSFSDLLSELDIGGAVVLRRDQGRHVLMADVQYYKLSPEDEVGPFDGTVSTTLKLPIVNAFYGYKVGDEESHGIFMGGVRYMKTDLSLTLTPNTPGPNEPVMRREASPSFTDVVVGMMIKQPLGAKWDLVLQGDIGFGGSNGTWNGMATFQRETQGGNFWTLGARVMGVDFDDVLPGGDLFVMDTTMAGLMVGFTWD